MFDKIIKFILGKIRIISLLIILTTLIIQVNGGSSSSRQLIDSRRSSQSSLSSQQSQSSQSQSCQSNQPLIDIRNTIQERIRNQLQEESGASANLPEIVKLKMKDCGKDKERTYSVRVRLTKEGKTEEYKYLAYFHNDKIIDVRSMDNIMAEIKKLKKMKDSKITNAAGLPEYLLEDIEERILQKLQEKSETAVIPKGIAKTSLIDYDEIANEIEYYVNFQTSKGKKTKNNKFAVSVRYHNGKQEIIDIMSKDEHKQRNLDSYGFK